MKENRVASTGVTMQHQRVITIDGPAAAGKTTVARLLADRLGAMLFDTGVLYRVVALVALRCGADTSDPRALAEIASTARVRITAPSRVDGRHYDVWLDDEDVTWAIREPEVGAIVSPIAEHQEVRSALLPLQRAIASGGSVVMVGRDIGTVVVPDAGLKVYLDATPAERARRRYREALARGSDETFAEVLAETLTRDSIDSGREAAPLREAHDAIRIDTDSQPVEYVVATIEALARTLRQPDGDRVWPT